MIDFLINEIDDRFVRENFEKLKNYLDDIALLSGDFKHFTIKVINPSSNYEFIHNLGFSPKDIIITFISTGTATPNYNLTTKKSISLNVSDSCEIRLLLGSVRGQ